MDEKKQVLPLYLSKELKKELEKIAKENGITINAVVRLAIKKYLKEG